MINKIMDIHNHTVWSDGAHTIEEIIENAIINKVGVVGISDHFNTIKCHSVSISNLEKYINTISESKEKYKEKIEVLAGVEICMNRKWSDLTQLPYDILNKLDYVLFEYIDWFKESVTLKGISSYAKKITCEKGLAHTNIFDLIKKYDRSAVIRLIKENNLFWELNVNEGYGYFDYILEFKDKLEISELFNKLKENEVRITVGSDTHSLRYYNINRLILGNKLAVDYRI